MTKCHSNCVVDVIKYTCQLHGLWDSIASCFSSTPNPENFESFSSPTDNIKTSVVCYATPGPMGEKYWPKFGANLEVDFVNMAWATLLRESNFGPSNLASMWISKMFSYLWTFFATFKSSFSHRRLRVSSGWSFLSHSGFRYGPVHCSLLPPQEQQRSFPFVKTLLRPVSHFVPLW